MVARHGELYSAPRNTVELPQRGSGAVRGDRRRAGTQHGDHHLLLERWRLPGQTKDTALRTLQATGPYPTMQEAVVDARLDGLSVAEHAVLPGSEADERLVSGFSGEVLRLMRSS